MLVLRSEVTVDGLTGEEIAAFLLECDDARYQEWWPGTHLEMHVLQPGSRDGHLGDVVLMDEYIGPRRVRMAAEVAEVSAERVVWQLRLHRLRLPVRLTLEWQNHEAAVLVRHTITVGWRRGGAVVDPLWRLYFSRSFAEAMDRHARTEFPLLRDLLRPASG